MTATMLNGYRVIAGSNHPMAPPYGLIGEHRIVLYDKIGPGVHPCHWCEKPVEWRCVDLTKPAPAIEHLVVDHLDGSRDNNAPENLAPACNRCNVWRARHPESFAKAVRNIGGGRL